jgi:hypothetical protein
MLFYLMTGESKLIFTQIACAEMNPSQSISKQLQIPNFMSDALPRDCIRIESLGVGDQFKRGACVNFDVYTISDLTRRSESVNLLEQSLASKTIT